MNLTPFEALFIAHLIMDWLLQWRWEAMNKSKTILALLFHCAVYTAGFVPVFLMFKISPIWLTLIFVSHAFLDNRKFEFWVLEKFKGYKKEENPEAMWTILVVGIDQVLHLAVLALIVMLS